MAHYLIVDNNEIWDSPFRDTVIDALEDENPPPPMEEVKSISDFYRDLTARWPELEDIEDAALGNLQRCPWTDPIVRAPGALLVSVDERALKAVVPVLVDLASAHALRVLDVLAGEWVGPPAP